MTMWPIARSGAGFFKRRPAAAAAAADISYLRYHHQRYRCYSAASTSASDPLRILFCGSDEFSCAALGALHAEKKREPSLIESLDVVVRPGKLTGRGMKKIREVPLKNHAEGLGLPIHVRDTFTGWQMKPETSINLIIAVSFGLFVPPRLLKLAKYGGLNVHPSLLPDFRGPAPLHHTLLQRRTHTGITLQTLHHESFDRGTVLAQTPLPGIPVPENCTIQDLHDIVTPLAAEMLVDGLRRGLHVPPLRDVGWKQEQPGMEQEPAWLRHAPKLTKHDRQVNWSQWSAEDVALRRRVLGPLWCEAEQQQQKGGRVLRLIFEDVQAVARPERVSKFLGRWGRGEAVSHPAEEIPEDGSRVKFVTWLWKPDGAAKQDSQSWSRVRLPYFEEEDGHGILIPTKGGDCLRIPTIKVEGTKSKPAAKAISGFGQTWEECGGTSESWGDTILSDALTVGLASWLDV